MPGVVVGSSGPAATTGWATDIQQGFTPDDEMPVGAITVTFVGTPTPRTYKVGIAEPLGAGWAFVCSGEVVDPPAGDVTVEMDEPAVLAAAALVGVTVVSDPPGLSGVNIGYREGAGTGVGGTTGAFRYGTAFGSDAGSALSVPFTLYAPEDVAVPAATDDTASTTGTTPVTVDVLDNDNLGVEPTAVTAVTQPANGTATFDATSVTYTADPGFDGEDSFTYTITDDSAATSTGTVTVTVEPAGEEPEEPSTADSPQHATLTANTVHTFTLDPGCNTVEVTNVDGAASIYFTLDGTAPVGEADGTSVIAAVAGARLIVSFAVDTISVVKAISTGTPKVSVRGGY